jgi:predicted RNase H-like nuclease (RuvC/YqgF family)
MADPKLQAAYDDLFLVNLGHVTELAQLRDRIAKLEYQNESIKRGQSQTALLTAMNEKHIERLTAENQRLKLERDGLSDESLAFSASCNELRAENQQLKAGILDRERACGNLSSRLVGEEIEIARLKAEAEMLRETANVARHNNVLNQEDHAECERLLKAALRWAIGAPLMAVERDTGEIYDADSGFAVEIPPEFAPLIAEAVEIQQEDKSK